MTSIKERTKWAITHVVKTRNLSNKKVANLLNINENTIGSYRNMVADPKVDFIVTFCDEFNFDILWFTKGVGEPFSGARLLFPEICEPAHIQKKIKSGEGREPEATYKTVGEASKSDLHAAVSHSVKELTTSLSSEIISFFESISGLLRQQNHVDEISSQIVSELQDRLDKIESRLDSIENMNQ